MRKRPRNLKGKLWRLTPIVECVRCHWCRCLLDYQSATVDHEPALAEGGYPESAVLACEPCNQERGRATNDRVNRRRKRRRHER